MRDKMVAFSILFLLLFVFSTSGGLGSGSYHHLQPLDLTNLCKSEIKSERKQKVYNL